ncbi:hypothetical protein IMCC1989_2193 [gamma proteobacterium IMCC1989]|nr:hypothetical protein IMCC1989_2193 [gamma proteobacterium IMCC1989]
MYFKVFTREETQFDPKPIFSSAITNVSQAYLAYFGALYWGFKDNVLAMFGQLINMYIGCFY